MAVPYHSFTGTLDISKVLKESVIVFDREIMTSFCSYKTTHMVVNNANNVRVPRESVYDAELYQILSNWLVGFIITG